MRIFLFIFLTLFAAPVLAQETAEKPALPAVDWVDVESTGFLSSAKGGALEKTLWQGQKRSVIEPLIDVLPPSQKMRTLLSLQRRLLMSKVDTALMEDDIGPMRGNDLLIRRINKLMQMGLYDDAWELYTIRAENPYDVSIARLGMLLMVMRADLATACLEEKVFAGKFPKDKFFETMDKACAVTLGSTKSPQFQDSPILQAVYNDKGFSVPASDIKRLISMSNLERAFVLANGKISYAGLNSEVLERTPPMLLTYYLMDKTLPESAKGLIKTECDKRGLTWFTKAISRDEAWAKANAIHDIPSQWPYVESALKTNLSPVDFGYYYGNMLETAAPTALSTDILKRALNVFLASGRPLPPFWAEKAKAEEAKNPIISIYLGVFDVLYPPVATNSKVEKIQNTGETLKSADFSQILAIIDSLDKSQEKVNVTLSLYEKDLPLTGSDNYVMHTSDLKVTLDTALEKKQLGITVLVVLNALAVTSDDMYSEDMGETLYSMLNVGLIEDAKLIALETIASILKQY